MIENIAAVGFKSLDRIANIRVFVGLVNSRIDALFLAVGQRWN
jgi:hypothetical protein